MFDFHMHSNVSFDGKASARDMALAARDHGMQEICFTDHRDYIPGMDTVFSLEDYHRAYDGLEIPGLIIRRGMEFGLTPTNQETLRRDLAARHYDFVLGSIHTVDDVDVYFADYWRGKTMDEAIRTHMEQTLRCVTVHDDYDVLAHLTFLSKARANPEHSLIRYDDYRDYVDEIFRQLVRHGKGLELNTSGVDRCGGPLPTLDYFRRFRELGGEIVTVGSDAHEPGRAGQYTAEMIEKLKEIFGYVCTFHDRIPEFRK